ncbi:hypothetical protein [Rhodopseudomonas pseudopalustris]|uniref:Uncharacterized protein n=1 Tax=Rhodopseudomonas pseudopalustris TaxID=1513892 RepID=A0A1H8UGG7_9BRAD|nr:hypothetical protein [Rhodopseudomonas pseudopalustris]SEP02320.1 hypothetical protein SAMN05444123_10742 [Rhodopseudomonas pseudopalustris]
MLTSKLEAAKRQLDCAIRLYLTDDHLSSVITLSRASFRLLWDIYPTIAQDGFEKPLGKVIENIGWHKLNAITNFLKHADKDTEAQMEPHDINARTGIGLGIILYSRATESCSPEMKAWESLMTLDQPEIWDSHPDPGHDGYADFKRALDRYKVSNREERLAMGRHFLRGFKRIEAGLAPE